MILFFFIQVQCIKVCFFWVFAKFFWEGMFELPVDVSLYRMILLEELVKSKKWRCLYKRIVFKIIKIRSGSFICVFIIFYVFLDNWKFVYILLELERQRERECEAFWEDWISKVGKETVFMAGCAKYYVFT